MSFKQGAGRYGNGKKTPLCSQLIQVSQTKKMTPQMLLADTGANP